jgi:hypothetical protein
VQYATKDTTDRLSKAGIKMAQRVVGSILYFARAVDPTMLTTTNTIASEQATPTKAVHTQAVRLLQFATAHWDHVLTFKKSKCMSSFRPTHHTYPTSGTIIRGRIYILR